MEWTDETQPLDIIHTVPEPQAAPHERARWLGRLLAALERPTLRMRPVR